MIFPDLPPAPRYQSQPLYLGDLRSRQTWVQRKPLIEIEVMRDIEDAQGEAIGRQRIKRRGVLNRAVGKVIHVGCFVYHMNEILAYREVKN